MKIILVFLKFAKNLAFKMLKVKKFVKKILKPRLFSNNSSQKTHTHTDTQSHTNADIKQRERNKRAQNIIIINIHSLAKQKQQQAKSPSTQFLSKNNKIMNSS